jgi:uncharacterized repeat protein (TIGR03803 family)
VAYDFPLSGDGAIPSSGLTSDGSSGLYGVTSGGGANLCSTYGAYFGCGTVFKLARSSGGQWKTSVIYSFKSTGGGFSPSGDLAFDETGSLYGVAAGSSSCTLGYCGIVFKLKPSSDGTWNESVIYSFMGGVNDGGMPDGGVVFDPEGNLYGTTATGGPTSCGDYGCGAIFKLSPTAKGGWKETILYFFTGTSDGSSPNRLVRDQEGNLYGTSRYGGSGGWGVAFKLSHGSAGWNLTVLRSFSGGLDGTQPWAGLIFDQEGNLYGTTLAGGLYDGGVVFKLSPGAGGVWNETALYNFIGVNGDGAFPVAGLTFDGSGNLYGTTTSGGGKGGACGGLGCGTVFELRPESDGKWKEKVLRRFSGGTDGGDPSSSVILDSSDNLYGTTMGGGSGAQGTVFEVKP